VRGTLFGERTENTLFYELATQPTESDLQSLVDAVASAVVSDWIPLLPTSWTGVAVYAKGLTEQFDVQAVNLNIAGDPGTQGSAAHPGNVTIAIKRVSGLTGRSTRGRIFWQGIPLDAVTGNNISTGYALDIVDAVEVADANAVALTWTPVIVSRQQGGVTPTNAVTYPIATWQIDDSALDSQRRRLRGRGI